MESILFPHYVQTLRLEIATKFLPQESLGVLSCQSLPFLSFLMHMNSMFLDCHRKTTFRTGEVLSYNHSSSTNFIYKGFADLKIENEARNPPG